MKTVYFGEIHRCKDGSFWVDDNKNDWRNMPEIKLSVYLGSLFGALIERLKLKKAAGSIIITVQVDGEMWKEAYND